MYIVVNYFTIMYSNLEFTAGKSSNSVNCFNKNDNKLPHTYDTSSSSRLLTLANVPDIKCHLINAVAISSTRY